MRRENEGLIVFLFWVCSSLCVDGQSQKWMNSQETTSPLGFSRVGSSVVFSMYGNVYPKGHYYVQLNVGSPPNGPNPYFLDPDTGSDLTWLQCDVPCVRCTEQPHPLYRPANDLVPCNDSLCTSLHGPGERNCDSPGQCDYDVQYADGGSSLGVLVRDLIHINLTNGIRASPRLAIGCGYDQILGTSFHKLDGILGLGSGQSSIVSQLRSQGVVKNVIGHCLSSQDGGFLFFGDSLYDPSRISWTAMYHGFSKHYSPGPAELILDGKASRVRNLPVVFDSGSSYTYFNSVAYQALITLLHKDMSKTPLTEAQQDPTLPICWKGKKPFKNLSEVRKYFRPLELRFGNQRRVKTSFELPPESYLIISLKGSVCLGILNGTKAGLQNLNVIGDISMQDAMIIYDNEKQVMGWAPANCNQNSKLRRAN